MTRTLLQQAVERVTVEGHDGRSGARIERVLLADGTRLVVKTAEPGSDLTIALTGNVERERELWASGALDRLPGGVAHAILDISDHDGATVTIMRDLGDAVPGWKRVLTAAECTRILDAMTAMHDEFADDTPSGLCPLESHLTLLSPARMAPLAGGPNPLAALVMRGWERFAELVEPDLVDAVFAIHDAPAPLARAMRDGPTTMLHADLWLVNLALEPDRVVFLDWAIATEGPPALDLAIFLTGSAAHVEPTREQIIAEFQARSSLTDERTIRLALLAGLVELGWNKALDAAEHPEPDIRAREKADLDWWLRHARTTLDQRLL